MNKVLAAVLLSLALLPAAAPAQSLAEYLDPETIAYASSASEQPRGGVWESIRSFLVYEVGLPLDEMQQLSPERFSIAVIDLPRTGEASFAIELAGALQLRYEFEGMLGESLAGWESSTEAGLTRWTKGNRLRVSAVHEDVDAGKATTILTNQVDLARRWQAGETRKPSLAGRLGGGPVEVHVDAEFFLERLVERDSVARLGDLLPGLRDRRIQSNEKAVIANLGRIAKAQAMFRELAAVDTDADGSGEFGYLQELAGTSPCRSSGRQADPTLLARDFGQTASKNGGVAEVSGYHFLVYLPVVEGPAQRERSPLPDEKDALADLQESRWVVYAWPVEYGRTGKRTFVVNQEGRVYAAPNAEGLYDGGERVPAATAAFALTKDAPIGDLATELAPADAPSGDGQAWRVAGD